MPSKSKSQQKFMGMVRAAQKGELENPSKSVKKAAKSMDKDDVDDFASTKHKGLPNKVKGEQRVRELIRKMVREMMDESRVKLATKKDVEFHGNIARLIGKKHSMGLDKKSLLMLLKAVRKHASITFNEGKLDESKVITLPNGVKVKISFGKVTLSDTRGKIELDRGELQKFGDAIKKHMRIREDFGGALRKGDRKKFDNMRKNQSEVLGYKLTGKDDIKTEIDDATVHESKERNYKEEYKKYGSSKKAKKYRAELNAYNRKKGTYGNGDKKDASHRGGKIVGFEAESKNRGRAEKSRLKKEGKLTEISNKVIQNLKDTNGKMWDYYYQEKPAYVQPFNEPRGEKIKVKDIKDKKLKVKIKQLDKILREGKLTEKSAISLNLWIKEFERLAKKNRMKPVDFIKKHISKRKGMDNEVVKDVLKHFQKNEGKLNEKMDRKKAAILLKQLGGNRFIAMTGAKGFAFSDKYMSFKIGRNSKGINFVRIGHNAKDLYDMEFGFVSVKGIKVKKKVKDVYADMLGTMFKKYTGMNVRL